MRDLVTVVRRKDRDGVHAEWWRIYVLVFLVGLIFASTADAQRRRAVHRPDPPPNRLILFDQAHQNFHRLGTTYRAFRELAEEDGWTLENHFDPFELQSLRPAGILVIVSPLAEQNVNDWSLPTPSAFTADEIDAVRDFVEEGGGLLLIADHMPFPGAIAELAAVFGVEWNNGFAFDTEQLSEPTTCLTEEVVHVFQREDGTLADHQITEGIDAVATFTGSALTGDITPLLFFNETSVSIMPETAWQFADQPMISVAGWSQGGVKQFGRGRVAMFGEAAMFTEQGCGFGGRIPMGMNSPLAQQNGELLLNVLNWLST